MEKKPISWFISYEPGKDRGKVDEDRLARLDTSALEIWTGEGQSRVDLFFIL